MQSANFAKKDRERLPRPLWPAVLHVDGVLQVAVFGGHLEDTGNDRDRHGSARRHATTEAGDVDPEPGI